MDRGGLGFLYASTFVGLLWVMVVIGTIARLTRVRIRRPRPRSVAPVWLTGLVGSLGTGLLLASPAGASGRRSSPSLVRSVASSEPWSETGGSTPLLPSVSDQAPWVEDPREAVESGSEPWSNPKGAGDDSSQPWVETPGGPTSGTSAMNVRPGPWEVADPEHDRVRPEQDEPSHLPGADERGGSLRAHPAIHRDRAGGAVAPLFPRHDGPARRTSCSERDACARRHPAGKALPQRARADRTRYVVQIGDTLWDIAASSLKTNDQRRIARYWPKIHRLNRAVIGSDPHHLLPGQKLELPAES